MTNVGQEIIESRGVESGRWAMAMRATIIPEALFLLIMERMDSTMSLRFSKEVGLRSFGIIISAMAGGPL